MRSVIVLAHPEPTSFNAQMAGVAARTLSEAEGESADIIDLHRMGFDPVERGEHYRTRADSGRFDAQTEQRHAADTDALPSDVRAQLEAIEQADLLILQYPMWWHLPPAMLKGWFDRVLIFGEVYASQKRFEKGRFAGRRAMLSVTVGTSAETYAFDGRSGDIDLLLWPVNFSLAYVGYAILSPFVAYGVEAGLRYSDEAVLAARLQRVAADLAAALGELDRRAVIPFNRMAEWGANGRIAAEAAVHSPFIRRKRHLDLE